MADNPHLSCRSIISIEDGTSVVQTASLGQSDDVREPQCPLTWWRLVSPREFMSKNATDRLRTAVIEASRWFPSPIDDPAMAVGRAIAVIWGRTSVSMEELDAHMSRVTSCALAGDRACAWFIASVLDRHLPATSSAETNAPSQTLKDAWKAFATR